MTHAPPGLLDTNVFIHARSNDVHSQECRAFLAALELGTIEARIEPIVVHELTYVMPRYARQMTRADIARFLLSVLRWPGVRGETDLLTDVVQRWGRSLDLGFADAYLAALATRQSCPVYTKNVRDLAGQGVVVPDPLPTVSAP